MWIKYPILILAFYFLALFQASFFAHFSVLGIVPNFVFIFFFLIVFLSVADSISAPKLGPKIFWKNLFYAILAGFFLDLFYFPFFGASIISLVIISVSAQKIFSSLREQKDKYPLNYFLILFLGSFLFYEIASALSVYFISNGKFFLINFGWVFVFKIMYNLLVAFVGFYICKYLQKLYASNRQLKLFG